MCASQDRGLEIELKRPHHIAEVSGCSSYHILKGVVDYYRGSGPDQRHGTKGSLGVGRHQYEYI